MSYKNKGENNGVRSGNGALPVDSILKSIEKKTQRWDREKQRHSDFGSLEGRGITPRVSRVRRSCKVVVGEDRSAVKSALARMAALARKRAAAARAASRVDVAIDREEQKTKCLAHRAVLNQAKRANVDVSIDKIKAMAEADPNDVARFIMDNFHGDPEVIKRKIEEMKK